MTRTDFFHNKTYVITGASSGIGRATALELARAHSNLVLIARRKEALERVASECKALGGQTLVCPLDVADAEAVQQAADRAVERFGRIDGWINNAAVTSFGRFENIPLDTFRRVMDTNFFGYVHGARAALPIFRRQGEGVLVQVASGVGKFGQPLTSPYVTSKFAVIGLSESLRQELSDRPGIQVSTILPASIDTPLFQQGANFYGREPKPIEPIFPPEKVAHAIMNTLKSPRQEIPVGYSVNMGRMAHVLAPHLFTSLILHKVEKNHFQNKTTQPSPGNLFEPKPEWAQTRGGWIEKQNKTKTRKKWAAGLALASLALGAGRWWTGHRSAKGIAKKIIPAIRAFAS